MTSPLRGDTRARLSTHATEIALRRPSLAADIRYALDLIDLLAADLDDVNVKLGTLEGELHLLATGHGAPNWKTFAALHAREATP